MRCPCFLLCWEVEPHITSQKAAPRSVQPGQAGSRVASVPCTPGPGCLFPGPSSPAQQRCALLTWHCWQSGYSQNTPEKLGISEVVQCGTCCSKQSPTESLQASSCEGSSAFAHSRQGTAICHLCHIASSTWQGRTGKPFNPDLSPHPLPACCFSLVFIKYLPPFAFEYRFHYPCTDPTIKNVNMA